MSEAAEVWVADILFTNGQAAKRRPVLVLWRDGPDRVVASITSSGPRTVTDVALADWPQARLRVASVVRLMRLDTFHDSMLTHRIGAVSRRDARTLNKAWAKHLKLSL